MNETHANALFIQLEEGVHDGCFLITKQRCPVAFAQWQARIEALPEVPSQDYQVKSICMDLLRPTQTHEEWRQMMRKIYEWRKHIVWMEGADECKTTNSTRCSDPQSSTNSQPKTTTNSKSITDSAQCLNGKRPADVATVEI